jgi:threonine dehydrogenase-like Zn-dependent dehydrogenase
MVEPYAVGVHAVNVANIQLGDHVAILGGGTIGMMIALAARAAGAGQIVMSEISDYRLDQIQKLGFIPIDSKVSDVKEEVFKLTGGAGTDIVFDAAGVPATAALMTQLLRSKGTAVIAGLYAHAPQVDLNDLNFRELVIRGTTVYTDQDFRFALQSLPVEELLQLVSHRLPIAEGEEGFRLSAGAKEAMKVLIQA